MRAVIIDGVRFRWGYDPEERQIFAVVGFADGTGIVIESPEVDPRAGVGIMITELLEALAEKGQISDGYLSLALGLTRHQFEGWGYPWESPQ